MDLKARVEALRDEAVAIRRDLHRHPELGFRETRTAGIVAGFLKGLDLAVRTGVASGPRGGALYGSIIVFCIASDLTLGLYGIYF